MASRDVKDADVPSRINGRALDEIRKEYNIPATVKLFAPTVHQRVNDEENFRIAVHEETLRIGIRFPFEGIVQSFLITFGVTPGQLTPNSWRILREISMWAEDNGIRGLSGKALLHLLTLKRSGDFAIVQGIGNSKIVRGMPTSNKGWKPGFFFAKRVNSRGEFVPWDVPYKWRTDMESSPAVSLSRGEAEALEALRVAIGSQGLPYTPAHHGREKAVNPPKRLRGPLKKASGAPLSIRPLQIRAPDEASPPRKKRKASEVETTEDAEFEAALQESVRTAAEPNREDAELQAALEESARLVEEGDPRPTDEQRLQIALAEAVEIGVLQLSSEDEAAEDEAAEDRHAPAPEDQQAPTSSAPADAAEGALPLVSYVDLEGASSPTAALPASATEGAQDAPASAEPSTADKATTMKEVLPEVPPPRPVFVPVDPEVHRVRVEEELVTRAPTATPKPTGVDFSLIARQKAVADNLRVALKKQIGMGPSDVLRIAGHAKTAALAGANAEAAKSLKKDEREKALRRFRRLEKQPAYAEHAPPQRYVGKTGRKAHDSDVQFDIHAFSGEPCVQVREGRPMLKARGSFNPVDLRASLDRKTDHLQAEVQTVIEAYREHLFQTAEAGMVEAQEEAFKEGMAVTERKWFERAAFAEAELGRYRNSFLSAENEKRAASATIFECEQKMEAAKAEVARAKEAVNEAVAAKEAAEKNAKEEARNEVRDELAGAKGNALALEAIAADFERRAKEQAEAAEASRKEVAEAKVQKAEAEALVAGLKGQVAEAEAKAESAIKRADEAEMHEQTMHEVATILFLEGAQEAAQEATAASEARAEAAEKALTNAQARNAELEEFVRRLEASARAATAAAETREREAEAAWARREVEVFNAALATVETNHPSFDLTDLYLIPDLPDPPVDGE